MVVAVVVAAVATVAVAVAAVAEVEASLDRMLRRLEELVAGENTTMLSTSLYGTAFRRQIGGSPAADSSRLLQCMDRLDIDLFPRAVYAYKVGPVFH